VLVWSAKSGGKTTALQILVLNQAVKIIWESYEISVDGFG